ncbi:FAD-dependent monooxygenase [Micromonospora olivasterospora]|uniref:FAD-dependent monooxygenase n=1 Tax=Micromonospora olivasterospora TaxID=1880 RepID=UPI0011A515E8
MIVGAGIAGLAAALRLGRSGWDVLVVEKAPGPRGGGYVVNFSGVGYEAAGRLGILPDLERAEQPTPELVYVDESGRRVAALPPEAHAALVGGASVTLLRGDLEAALHRALSDRARLRFGTTVTRLDQDDDGVDVGFSDGTDGRFDLVVGADGLHSQVRAAVFGPEERFRADLGHAVISCLLPEPPRAARLDAAQSVGVGLVGRGVGITPTADGRCAAFFAFRTDDVERDLREGPVPTLRRVYGDLGWVVPDLLTAVAKEDSIYFDRICQIRMERWHQGRVVLLGDSAWCVSLFAGSGSSLAVGGAELLGDVLDRHHGDPSGALAAWEAEFRPLVLSRQREALRATAMFVAPNATALWLRTMAFRLSGSRPVRWAGRRFFGNNRRAAASS